MALKSTDNVMKKANIVEYLRLGKKDENGAVRATGKHILEIVNDKETKGKDILGKEIDIVRFLFNEITKDKDGKEIKTPVKYDVAVMNKTGDDVNYLIKKMNEFNYGDLITMEMKKSGIKSFIDVEKYYPDKITAEMAQANAEKIIDANAMPDEDDIPVIDDGEEIDIKDIPF